MNIGVTIETGARLSQAARTRRIAGTWQHSRNIPAMAGRLVTLLTQKWGPRLEHAGNVGAVRVVADGAIVRDRLVIENKRPTLLHVAGVAGVNNVIAHEQFHARRAMRVVAVGTCNLAFPDGMMR